MLPLSQGHDAFVGYCGTSGRGRNAAFLLPIIDSILNARDCFGVTAFSGIAKPKAIILSPKWLRCHNIWMEANKLSECCQINSICLYEGKDWQTTPQMMLNWLQTKRCDILVATPKMLSSVLKDKLVDLSEVKHLILDHADHVFHDSSLSKFVTEVLKKKLPPREERVTGIFVMNSSKGSPMGGRALQRMFKILNPRCELASCSHSPDTNNNNTSQTL